MTLRLFKPIEPIPTHKGNAFDVCDHGNQLERLGLVHVDVRHIGPTLRKLGIEYRSAIVSYEVRVDQNLYSHRQPRYCGAVIRKEDVPTLLDDCWSDGWREIVANKISPRD
jgi:hypothetical protein